jgi:hypothetical protein
MCRNANGGFGSGRGSSVRLALMSALVGAKGSSKTTLQASARHRTGRCSLIVPCALGACALAGGVPPRFISAAPGRGTRLGPSTRTDHEPICEPCPPGASLMPEILADPLPPSCYDLFSGPGSRNLNNLLLIPSPLARVTRGGALRREAPAIRGAGRAAFPIPSGGCPILPPGR